MKKLSIIVILLLSLLLTSGCSVSDFGLEDADGKPRVSSNPYLYDIAEGNIEDHKGWMLLGYNPNIGTSIEAVWEYSVAYTFPSAPIQMEVVSTSAQDGVAGTGALQMFIQYLDYSFNQHTEIVTMNGTTPVPTTSTNIYRINYFHTWTTGSSGASVGNVTLRGIGGGIVYSYLIAGRNNSKNMIYTVPAGYDLYVTSLTLSSAEAAKGVRFTLRANCSLGWSENPIILDHFIAYADVISFNTVSHESLELPFKFISGTDLIAIAVSTQAGAIANTAMQGWLEAS